MPAAPAATRGHQKQDDKPDEKDNGKVEETPAPRVTRATRSATYTILYRDEPSGPWQNLGEVQGTTQREARTKSVTPEMVERVRAGGHVELVAIARWEPQHLKIEVPPPKISV